MNRATLDLWVGIFVAMGLGAILFLALKVGNLVSFYTETLRLGRTSITVRVSVEVERGNEGTDRVLVTEAEVTLECDAGTPIRCFRAGPIWLGLVAGLHFELPRVDDA